MVRRTKKNLALVAAEPIPPGVSTTARGNCEVIDLTLEDNDVNTISDGNDDLLGPVANLYLSDSAGSNIASSVEQKHRERLQAKAARRLARKEAKLMQRTQLNDDLLGPIGNLRLSDPAGSNIASAEQKRRERLEARAARRLARKEAKLMQPTQFRMVKTGRRGKKRVSAIAEGMVRLSNGESVSDALPAIQVLSVREAVSLVNGGRTVADQDQPVTGAELMVIDDVSDTSAGDIVIDVDAHSSDFARSVFSNGEPAEPTSVDQSVRLESRAEPAMTDSRTGHSLTDAVLAVAPERQAEADTRRSYSSSDPVSPNAPVMFLAGTVTHVADSASTKPPDPGPGLEFITINDPTYLFNDLTPCKRKKTGKGSKRFAAFSEILSTQSGSGDLTFIKPVFAMSKISSLRTDDELTYSIDRRNEPVEKSSGWPFDGPPETWPPLGADFNQLRGVPSWPFDGPSETWPPPGADFNQLRDMPYYDLRRGQRRYADPGL
ncbi:hypothetical protein HDU86_002518 [Geranomyces michiganensis]|nr:hypothetical protein HDU86_002518 [Geranomyces michiganensis]